MAIGCQVTSEVTSSRASKASRGGLSFRVAVT
jgi:hypothetical protein